MAIQLRKLEHEDLPIITDMCTTRLQETNLTSVFSMGIDGELIFPGFVLPKSNYNSTKRRMFGVFDNDQLVAVLGIRDLDLPAWVLSFIITKSNTPRTIAYIKALINFAIGYQEERGLYQWFVTSKLEKFSAWQKTFQVIRERYHHYVYARIPAHEMPKWCTMIFLTGNKTFPYDVNISMYISKHRCTSDDSDVLSFSESDVTLL